MEITPFVKRPGVGREGKPVKIRTNFFEVTSMPEENIIPYDISITPEVPPRLNRRIFDQFVSQYRGRALGGARPVFDGTYSKVLFVTNTPELSKTKRNVTMYFFYSIT